jgi:UDP-2,4-diacetamido-2,4,6-trideoxy-beta-L-altropyranose hydrolase
MPETQLVIRADANPENGAGHVMRCAALAEAWHKAKLGPVSIRGTLSLAFVQERVRAACIEMVSYTDEVPQNAILLVDSYDQRDRVWGAGAAGACRVLVDDLGEPVPVGFDVVWNPNAYGSRDLYPDFAGTTITGPDAVAIRDDLSMWRGSGSRAVSVVLGGGRIGENLRRALEQLSERFPDIVFKGSGEWVPRRWDRLDPLNLWDEVAVCSRLITAAGSTVWEAAACGIPVSVIRTAPNQCELYKWATASGVPGLQVEPTTSSDDIADALERAIMRATPLPRLSNGAPKVAEAIMKVAARSTRPAKQE